MGGCLELHGLVMHKGRMDGCPLSPVPCQPGPLFQNIQEHARNMPFTWENLWGSTWHEDREGQEIVGILTLQKNSQRESQLEALSRNQQMISGSLGQAHKALVDEWGEVKTGVMKRMETLMKEEGAAIEFLEQRVKLLRWQTDWKQVLWGL